MSEHSAARPTSAQEFDRDDVTYELDRYSEDVEDVDQYRVGGYHPLKLGDCLNGRYEIIHKLGFGSYAVVWLARDRETETNVAIKISIAGEEAFSESQVLRALDADDDSHGNTSLASQTFVTKVLDEFDVVGPNGRHHCLVMAAARSSIHDAREWSGRSVFQLPTARAIVAQLSQAVEFIHGKGVVHGDLHPGNVLLRLSPSLEHLSRAKVYDICGEPELLGIKRSDGKPLTENVPSHAVARAYVVPKSETVELHEAQVLLADFGEAFLPKETLRTKANVPLKFCPPEHIVSSATQVAYSSDIWTLACTIFVILGQRHLFDTFIMSSDQVLTEQLDAFGKAPDELFASWENRSEHFNEAQEPVGRDADGPTETFSERLDEWVVKARQRYDYGQIEDDEARALDALLRSMLAMKAEERIAAKEVLESEWMVKWALPDLERAQELWEKEELEARDDST